MSEVEGIKEKTRVDLGIEMCQGEGSYLVKLSGQLTGYPPKSRRCDRDCA